MNLDSLDQTTRFQSSVVCSLAYFKRALTYFRIMRVCFFNSQYISNVTERSSGSPFTNIFVYGQRSFFWCKQPIFLIWDIISRASESIYNNLWHFCRVLNVTFRRNHWRLANPSLLEIACEESPFSVRHTTLFSSSMLIFFIFWEKLTTFWMGLKFTKFFLQSQHKVLNWSSNKKNTRQNEYNGDFCW